MEVQMRFARTSLAGVVIAVLALVAVVFFGASTASAGHIDATGAVQSNCVEFQAGDTGTKSPADYQAVSVTLDSWADTLNDPHEVTFTIAGLTVDQEIDISVKSGNEVVEDGPYGNGQHTFTSQDQQAISHIRLCVFEVDTTSSSSSSSSSTPSSSSSSSSIAATSSSTSLASTTSSSIEDEVLGTTITTSTTSTTIEDEVLDTEVLPFTGFGGEGFGLLALAIISAGLLLLVAGRSIER